MSHFLLGPEGEAFLRTHYVEQGESTHTIAARLGTYPNRVRRALLAHGIQPRTRRAAQQRALDAGRSTHPTAGSVRRESTRDRIGDRVSEIWHRLDAEERALRTARAKSHWDGLPPARKEELRLLAEKGMRKAARHGSDLERFLAARLRAAGHEVRTRAEVAGRNVDLWLPAFNLVLQVEGPAHYLPIWGDDQLLRIATAAGEHARAIVAEGLTVVRIKNLAREVSAVRKRGLLTQLLCALGSMPRNEASIIEMEIV